VFDFLIENQNKISASEDGFIEITLPIGKKEKVLKFKGVESWIDK